LGAGTSRSAGLPTATDILWDLKRRYYCRAENQEITRQDIQNPAIRNRIQSYMISKGFPDEWAPEEYTTYFERIFGTDKSKQRDYLKAVLSEDKARLAVGHRVLAALMSLKAARAVFTTNFDAVIEKAFSEVAGGSLSAFHLEAAHNAKEALDREEYPFYCKLHGDFKYDSIKNLSADLSSQNAILSKAYVNAGNRFGVIVCGYSGRDESVMKLFESVLESQNPFPHGIYWTYLKGSAPPHRVEQFLEKATAKGVKAYAVAVETFDTLMLRIWRNTSAKTTELDEKVRKTQITAVSIPVPDAGTKKPLMRLNAVPILQLPEECLELKFKTEKSWHDLRDIQRASKIDAIFTKADNVWAWGNEDELRAAFGNELVSILPKQLPDNLETADLHVRGFIEEALGKALARKGLLLARKGRDCAIVIVDHKATDVGALEPLFSVIGKPHGEVAGLFSPVTVEHPHAQKVAWAEAVRISLDFKQGQCWAQLDPDVWIWPPRARSVAISFLDGRRGDRLNKKYNDLLDGWLRVIFDSDERNIEIDVSAFDGPPGPANPTFKLSNRTGYSLRSVA